MSQELFTIEEFKNYLNTFIISEEVIFSLSAENIIKANIPSIEERVIPIISFAPGVLEGFIADVQDEKYMESLGYKKKDNTPSKEDKWLSPEEINKALTAQLDSLDDEILFRQANDALNNQERKYDSRGNKYPDKVIVYPEVSIHLSREDYERMEQAEKDNINKDNCISPTYIIREHQVVQIRPTGGSQFIVTIAYNRVFFDSKPLSKFKIVTWLDINEKQFKRLLRR